MSRVWQRATRRGFGSTPIHFVVLIISVEEVVKMVMDIAAMRVSCVEDGSGV